MPKYLTVTRNGARMWEADNSAHAREQHVNGFGDDPDEQILSCKAYLGFSEGDRVFSHYEMKWGTILKLGAPSEILNQGEPTGRYDAWHEIKWDDGRTSSMNDAGTHPMGWEWARIVPPNVAEAHGYGSDPMKQPLGIELPDQNESVTVTFEDGTEARWAVTNTEANKIAAEIEKLIGPPDTIKV